jgi:hypothetical protein
MTTIKATNAIAMNDDMTVAIKTINATIMFVAKRLQEQDLEEER